MTTCTKDSISIPMKWVGPIAIVGEELNGLVSVPLATFETPMWPSTNRGASVTRHAGGVRCHLIDDRMTRSILVEGENAAAVHRVVTDLPRRRPEIEQILGETSRHLTLLDWHHQIVGNLLYLRLEIHPGDASGHNMVTKAADALLRWLVAQYPLQYVSISANYCTDKKVSAVNGILGRGKYVVAEMIIPRAICLERLKTTPEAIVNLHIKKNLIGTNLAGGLRTANAHFANILLALYLATGQDAANIVEGSQGLVHAELRNNQQDLYFSVTIPNIIVGTVGNGKHHAFVREHLAQMGLEDPYEQAGSARRLAIITAAAVWCGEISLLAAQTNPGELMRAHVDFERGNANYREPVTST